MSPLRHILPAAAASAWLASGVAFAGEKSEGACFGGEPQVALAKQYEPQELVVADGKLHWQGNGMIPHIGAFPAADRRYLYFAQAGVSISRVGTGFYRIPRSGGGDAELLGTEPHAHHPFAVEGGFVYYLTVSAGGPHGAVVRRTLQPNAKPQVLAPLGGSTHRWRHVPA